MISWESANRTIGEHQIRHILRRSNTTDPPALTTTIVGLDGIKPLRFQLQSEEVGLERIPPLSCRHLKFEQRIRSRGKLMRKLLAVAAFMCASLHAQVIAGSGTRSHEPSPASSSQSVNPVIDGIEPFW
jgi:hypothetical protein